MMSAEFGQVLHLHTPHTDVQVNSFCNYIAANCSFFAVTTDDPPTPARCLGTYMQTCGTMCVQQLGSMEASQEQCVDAGPNSPFVLLR